MMSGQPILAAQADGGFETNRKATRRDVFLAEMDKVVPGSELCTAVEPSHPKARPEGCRRPTLRRVSSNSRAVISPIDRLSRSKYRKSSGASPR
jgi:hypothetical protein